RTRTSRNCGPVDNPDPYWSCSWPDRRADFGQPCRQAPSQLLWRSRPADARRPAGAYRTKIMADRRLSVCPRSPSPPLRGRGAFRTDFEFPTTGQSSKFYTRRLIRSPEELRMVYRFLAGVIIIVITFMQAQPARAGTSNSLLDLSPDGHRLLVANPDNSTVTVVDADMHRALRKIKVGEKPEGVAWINKRCAAVTVYRESKILFFDPEEGKILSNLAVAPEPYGIVTNKNHNRAFVTHDYPGTVTEINLETSEVVREMKVGAFTRGIALTAD